MTSLRDSGKIAGPVVSIRQLADQCNLSFPLSLSQFLVTPGCPFSTCIRIHIKVLTYPNYPIDTMLRRMHDIYATAGIGVVVVSREELMGPDFTPFNDLDVGSCERGGWTGAQLQLYQHRNYVGDKEIVIYFVRTIMMRLGYVGGCATYPPSFPGVAVSSQGSNEHTAAHEVAHVLGLEDLKDCSNPLFVKRLMCGWSVQDVSQSFIQSEIDMMRMSEFIHQC